MLAATGEYRFMCDADLAMPIDRLPSFLNRMAEGYDVVIGSRQIAGARRFDEPRPRHIMGRLFNAFVRLVAVRGIEDTQCGFKCFRGEVADELFALQRTKGFAFDVEILRVAQRRGMRVLEMPVDWQHQSDSKVRPGVDTPLMVKDTLMVRWHEARGRYGNPARRTASVQTNVGRASEARDEPSAARRSDNGSVAVVVPTYNEAESLPRLAERLFALGTPGLRLIVVDDGSPDGTAQVARELSERFGERVEVVERAGKQGLGTAYVEGFGRALAQQADYVVQMDADLSHAPEYIPKFIEELSEADVVVGSRYVPGATLDERWGIGRRLLSALANTGIRTVAGLKVRDATAGFKAYRAAALRSLALGRLRCKGFGFQVEVAKACERRGHRVVEYPIRFADRTEGRSKMSAGIALEAMWRLLLLRLRR